MRNLFFLMLALLFSFCSKEKQEYPRLIVPDVDNIVEVNSKVMLNNKPTLLAINFSNDTSLIAKFSKEREKSIEYLNPDTILPKYKLKIIIDTSYFFYSKGFEYKNIPWPKSSDTINLKYSNVMEREEAIFNPYFKKLNKLLNTNVSSYPVLIFNLSNTKAFISNAFSLADFHLIQEAKDSDGKWKPIEFQKSNSSFGGCAPLYPNYSLLPKHFLATSIIKYHGSYKTKIRVKLFSGIHYYYSNEITAYINPSQFDQSFAKIFLKERGYEEKFFKIDKDMMFLDFSDYLDFKRKNQSN